jgi:hypothetical protein
MILADTSVWIDHFRITNLGIVRAIREQSLLLHPYQLITRDRRLRDAAQQLGIAA